MAEMTPQDEPVATETDIHSNFNACMHRDYCRQLKRERDASVEALREIAEWRMHSGVSEYAKCDNYADQYYLIEYEVFKARDGARDTLRAIEEGRK